MDHQAIKPVAMDESLVRLVVYGPPPAEYLSSLVQAWVDMANIKETK